MTCQIGTKRRPDFSAATRIPQRTSMYNIAQQCTRFKMICNMYMFFILLYVLQITIIRSISWVSDKFNSRLFYLFIARRKKSSQSQGLHGLHRLSLMQVMEKESRAGIPAAEDLICFRKGMFSIFLYRIVGSRFSKISNFSKDLFQHFSTSRFWIDLDFSCHC